MAVPEQKPSICCVFSYGSKSSEAPGGLLFQSMPSAQNAPLVVPPMGYKSLTTNSSDSDEAKAPSGQH